MAILGRGIQKTIVSFKRLPQLLPTYFHAHGKLFATTRIVQSPTYLTNNSRIRDVIELELPAVPTLDCRSAGVRRGQGGEHLAPVRVVHETRVVALPGRRSRYREIPSVGVNFSLLVSNLLLDSTTYDHVFLETNASNYILKGKP